MSIVVGYDLIGANIGHAPAGAQLASYTTGSGGVPAPASFWRGHPTAVRIDQDPAASDPTADVLDVETGAATFADCPGWVKRARRDYGTAARPGQREPAIYASASNLTSVADALIGGGVSSGVFLWVANWSLTEAQAVAMLTAAGGPFPVCGVQFSSGGFYDTDVWSKAWLGNVSARPAAGWQAYKSDGTKSLAQIGADVGMVASSILRHTAAHYGAFDARTSEYLNAVFSGTLIASDPVPPGASLWVRG